MNTVHYTVHRLNEIVKTIRIHTEEIMKGKTSLGGGFTYFLFSPLPGEMMEFD